MITLSECYCIINLNTRLQVCSTTEVNFIMGSFFAPVIDLSSSFLGGWMLKSQIFSKYFILFEFFIIFCSSDWLLPFYFSSVKRTIAPPNVTFVQGFNTSFILILDQSPKMAVQITTNAVRYQWFICLKPHKVQ